MSNYKNSKESGQSIVLFTLMILAFIAILALVLDGGLAYASRRKAQNAADAGALAGATVLCQQDSVAAAESAAIDYAVNKNGAAFADANAILNSVEASISVTATVDYNTAFAALLGQPNGQAAAKAKSACLPVCGASGVVPIAWSCNPPVIGDDGLPEGDSEDCAMSYGPEHIYVIMDSDKTIDDIICQDPPNSGLPVGAFDCDFDNDDINDIGFGGNRSWIYLGPGEASLLSEWMEFGYDGILYPHTWFSGKPGVTLDTFIAASTRIGDVIAIPVYDSFCEEGDPREEPVCTSLIHTNDIFENVVRDETAFHVIEYATFTITCIDAGPLNDEVCPGREAVEAAYTLATGKQMPANLGSIEGYFLEGTTPGFAGCPVGTDPKDVGSWTVNLIP